MNIVTKEEDGGKKSKGCEIKSNPKGLLMYSEVPGLPSLVAKDKDAKVIFIQEQPLWMGILTLKGPYLHIKLRIDLSRLFFGGKMEDDLGLSLIAQVQKNYKHFL